MAHSKTLGIVHTSFALVDLLRNAVRTHLPGVAVVNLVDDTLLDYARAQGVDDRLHRRMHRMFEAAVDAGADVILNACSSVGETVDAARNAITVPIVKIDEEMADRAVRLGPRIGVFATVQSTLGPTRRLLEARAAVTVGPVKCVEILCEGGFDLLLQGKTAEHDGLVAEVVCRRAAEFDVLVFAQASMARLAPIIAPQVTATLLTSPELAMTRLRPLLA